MPTVLYKSPAVTFAKEAYLTLLEEGYALPIHTQDNATVLLFDNVDDHTDGNGMAILWMLEGEGTFYYEGDAIAFKRGDVLVFDDNFEHGFEADGYCVAVNIDIGPVKDPDATFIQKELDAFVASHQANIPIFENPSCF